MGMSVFEKKHGENQEEVSVGHGRGMEQIYG